MADSKLMNRWYNTTYALFSVSILLTAIFRNFAGTNAAADSIFGHVDRAIAILQAMDECVVARNSIKIIKRTLSRAKAVHATPSHVDRSSTTQEPGETESAWDSTSVQQGVSSDDTFAAIDTGTGEYRALDDDIDWFSTDPNPFEDYQQALFWTTWAQEVNSLGT